MKTNERKYAEKPVGLYWSNGKTRCPRSSSIL
jgi:hypothetical protein